MKNFLSKNKLSIAALVSVAIPTLIYLLIPHSIHAEKLYEVLTPCGGSGQPACSVPSATVKSVWDATRNLINYIVMAFLIYVAFLNILRIQMNNYAIKKVLPALVMGVILANFSFLICRFFVDLSNVAMGLLINSPAGGAGIGTNDYGIAGNFAVKFDLSLLTKNSGQSLNQPVIWQYMLLALLEFAGSIVILILAFIFFIRNYVIYFLVALSPLAFMVTGIPLAKSVWNQWWTNFTKWTFMPIVSLFWLWLGGKWLAPLTGGVGSLPNVPGLSLISLVFAGVCFYLAITTPFKMGGAVMSGYGKIGKQIWGRTGGAAWKSTGGAAVNAVRSGINARYDRTKQSAKNSFYGRTPLGRYMKRSQANQRFLNTVVSDATAKIDENADKDRIQMAVRDLRRRQAANLAAGRVNAQGQPDANYGIDPILRSRIIAKSRKFIQGEAETPRGVGSDALMDRLRGMNALGAGDVLLSEDALLNLPNQSYFEVKAIVNEIRKQQRQTTLGPAARANFATLVPDAATRQRAEGQDIATDLLASSVVGDRIEDETTYEKEHSDVIRSIAGKEGDALVQAAHHGEQSIDDVLAGTDVMSNLTPGAQQLLRASFGEIRKKRDDMINELVDKGKDEVDEAMVGATLAYDNLGTSRNQLAVSTRLTVLDSQAGAGLAHLQNGNIEEASKIAEKFGLTVQTGSQDVQGELEKTFGQMRSGIKDLREMGAAKIATDSKLFEAQLREAKTKPLKDAAETTVASQFAVRDTAPPQALSGVSVSQIGENQEALQELTGHFNEIMSQVGQARGLDQPPQTTPAGASNFFKELSSGAAPGSSVASVLSDPRAMDMLAQKIGKATVLAQGKIKPKGPANDMAEPKGPTIVNNFTNTPATPSPSIGANPPTPPSKPDAE